MGQEIPTERFKKQDFRRFGERLREETELLGQWFARGVLSRRHGTCGFELEAWLVDEHKLPAPVNAAFLGALNHPLVVPELSRFNIELNSTPRPLSACALSEIHSELEATWGRCRETGKLLGVAPVMIGILPTVSEEMLTPANMSSLQRYRALNEQVIRLRHGKPQRLDIQGAEHLHAEHSDVMLEAATTSFQVHLQVDPARAARYFNAAQILSAPMVALSANSPFLFGRRLWRETRIPLFEQAVVSGGFEAAGFGPIRRVTFGSGYVRASLMEVFRENLEHYPILLPVVGEAERPLGHLRLHNGTIWRWNRPLIGFDDGIPHVRIEHRVMPSGPTTLDCVANAAVFLGLVRMLAEQELPPEAQLPFSAARENLYAAAKHSLAARLTWLDGRRHGAGELLSRELLPLAREGLRRWECCRQDAERLLGVVEARVRNRQTGAAWQIGYVESHGHDFTGLVGAYRQWQESGRPVHEWTLNASGDE